MLTFRVLDFETDGMPPEARICEIGWVDVRTYADVLDPAEIGDPVSMLINTGRPMPPEARAVHHISEADLVDAPNVDHGLMALSDGPSDKIFVAHNCEFEKSFFAPAGRDWICTLKVARRLWPECPSHTDPWDSMLAEADAELVAEIERDAKLYPLHIESGNRASAEFIEKKYGLIGLPPDRVVAELKAMTKPLDVEGTA